MYNYFKVPTDTPAHVLFEKYALTRLKWERVARELSKYMKLESSQIYFGPDLKLNNLSLEQMDRFAEDLFCRSSRIKKHSRYYRKYKELLKYYSIDESQFRLPLQKILKPKNNIRLFFLECFKSDGQWYLMMETKKSLLVGGDISSIGESEYLEMKSAAEYILPQ